MKKIVLLFFSVFLLNSHAQNFVWAKQFGAGDFDRAYGIVVDSKKNVYATGFILGSVDMDPGPGVYLLNGGGCGSTFVCKLDSSGNFVWAVSMLGNCDSGFSITLDKNENVYVTGNFAYTTDFDPGPAVLNVTSNGSMDFFICKFNSAGKFLWAKTFGGSGWDEGNGITIDSKDNVYTTGFFNNSVDFDPGTGIYNMSSLGGSDIFVSKLDSSGNFVWAKQMGGLKEDRGKAIVVDNNDDIITTGFFCSAPGGFDPGPGPGYLYSAGNEDIFICKLNALGSFVWAKRIGGVNGEQGNSIAVDKVGNIYSTGFFEGSVDFDPSSASYVQNSLGSSDIYISKLSSSGNFKWAKRIGGSTPDYGASLKIGNDNCVYTTGGFSDNCDFDPGIGVYNISPPSNYYEVFINRLDTSGKFICATSMGGIGSDEGRSIAIDNQSNIYTTGYFYGTSDYDPGVGTYTLNSSSGSYDIFISKLAPCAIKTEIEEMNQTNSISIFPNPTTGILKIEYSDLGHTDVTLILRNALGELIYTSEFRNSDGFINADLSNYSKGIYIIELRNGNEYIRKKVVLQ